MLPRHRRRQYLAGNSAPGRPALFVRLIIGAVILFAVWFLATSAMSLFDKSIGRKTAAVLELQNPEGVQVSLQEEEWQRAENGLKLYAGDAVATRGTGDATLTLFDGTKVRLDTGTDVVVVTSDNEQDGKSTISLKVRSGRLWVVTPDITTYSGSIVRTISTLNYSAEIPASSNILIGSSLLNVMRASGLGANVTLTFTKSKPSLFVGEGQYLTVSEQVKRLIDDGSDPYDFRDPVTLDLLKDPFLVSSYVLMNSTNSTDTSQGSGTSPLPTNELPLVLTSPENNAPINAKTVIVAGKVGARVSQLKVNGQSITIKPNLSFSAELSLPKDQPSFLITVEAQDVQGVPVAKIERIVNNIFKVSVEPVRIKSPVGSGETLRTSQNEVEITGEVSSGIAAVVVNDYKLQLFTAGNRTWSYLASTNLNNLNPGENTFTVYAMDADGNRSPTRTITIIFTPGNIQSGTGSTSNLSSSQPAIKQNPPLSPGVLIVDKPVSGVSAVTSEKEIVIEGRTSADTASISINGYTLSLYLSGKTTWNYIASTELGTLKRGKNVYRVVARNATGEILDVLEYTITFNP